MTKPNTMDDLMAEILDCFNIDVTLTAKEMERLYALYTTKLQEVDRAARIDEQNWWLDCFGDLGKLTDEELTALRIPRLWLRDTANARLASLKGGDV